MLRSSRLKTCRGTELLDELANILSNLYSFNEDNDLEFASTIILLHRYWDNLKERTDNNSELRSAFIRILDKMAILYGDVNIPVACGARVIACDVESSYLNDEEAQLVTASLASTSTVPRLLFKRNQPEPEISRIWSPDVLATATSRQWCLPRQDRRHWASRSRLSSCGRSTRSCRRGLRAVLFRVGIVASFGAWSISGDRGLGQDHTASALPSRYFLRS
jgi:hypothetical protein